MVSWLVEKSEVSLLWRFLVETVAGMCISQAVTPNKLTPTCLVLWATNAGWRLYALYSQT